MPQRKVRALCYDKAGIAHAFTFTGAKRSFCDWRRYNFNKMVSLERCEWGDGHVYEPPKGVFVTCLTCVAKEAEEIT